MKHIAILGANSHIAKSLLHYFLDNKNFHIHLFTRSYSSIDKFVSIYNSSNYTIHEGYTSFSTGHFDCIINCIGVGTNPKSPSDYFTLTEHFDNLCIDYLQSNPRTLYLSLSSGIVYNDFTSPSHIDTINCIKPNNINPSDYYSIARLNAEAKHRSFSHLNIIDLRLFSYFSRFIDLTDEYFITSVLNSIIYNKPLITTPIDIIRDYIHPSDFFTLITALISNPSNTSIDISSALPVSKQQILDYFSSNYNLKYEKSSLFSSESATGLKNIYYSTRKNPYYTPVVSSIDTIIQESKYILGET